MSTSQPIAAVVDHYLRSADAPDQIEVRQTFHYAFDVYLKDSNAFANTYFARYFEWQGVMRERWFHECIDANMMGGGAIFMTKRAHQEFVEETFPFQRVDCYLNTFRVRPCSAYLVFRFMSEGRLVSLGYQQIVFAGTDRSIRRLPERVMQRAKDYELPELPHVMS
ncbi:acyl-CoA thioesterase [Ralstonia pseudosolanacearum]|uniref:acyl-CoA thioesterase n=1 Tax=Ralstonia pseudosolanacearum TaxID=1310165 RepID=UPI0040538C3C